jgi:hypothetical protein
MKEREMKRKKNNEGKKMGEIKENSQKYLLVIENLL